MTEIASILKKCLLFSDLNTTELEQVRDSGLIRKYQKNEIIFRDNETAKGFFVVLSGMVKIYRLSPEGREHILHLLSEGETFAEAAMFAGKNYPAYAEALKDSRVFFIDRTNLVKLIEESSRLVLKMMASQAKRLRRFADMIEDLSLKEVSARLAKYILDTALKEGEETKDGIRFNLNISKTLLAASLGTINETISRTMADFKNKGFIEENGGKIIVLNKIALEKISLGFKS